MRLKQGIVRPGDSPCVIISSITQGEPVNESKNNVEMIDVSDYQPKRIPSIFFKKFAIQDGNRYNMLN